MNNYQDRLGFMHDVPVTKDNPFPSNNPFIYSAYYEKLNDAYIVDEDHVINCWHMKVRNIYKPDSPPLSRDEILGMAYLSKTLANFIINNRFYFYKSKPSLNIFKMIYQLIKLHFATRKLEGSEKRNYFWKNKGFEQVYLLSFVSPLHDRAFIYRCADKRVPVIYSIIEWIDKKITSKHRSSRCIRWLKYNNQDYDALINYFPPDHPIVLRIFNKEK